MVDLNQVTIPCKDYAASVAFYRTIGLRQIVDDPPRYARFESSNGATFSIHLVELIADNPHFIVYFEVENVDATVAQLKAKGLTIDDGPTDQEWLWREAYLRDPAGNMICIYHAGENRRSHRGDWKMLLPNRSLYWPPSVAETALVIIVYSRCMARAVTATGASEL